MEAKMMSRPSLAYILLLAFIIILCCFGLGYLDHETEQFSDLLTAQNIAALLLYFLPTFVVCLFLYAYFLKKNNNMRSVVSSLISGVPLSFLFVICLLLVLMKR